MPFFSSQIEAWWVKALTASGEKQMALDEALLTWAQDQATPMLIGRTYRWERPTLSLGVHQKGRDAEAAYRAYTRNQPVDLVIRPTGGRAILHGADVSFAFICNDPALLKCSLHQSYATLTAWVQQALENCGVPLQTTDAPDDKAYLRSALCFETQTPSDLMTPTGQKVCGSAQLRRHGGILQHGAAFLEPFGIAPQAFDKALQDAISHSFKRPLNILTLADHPHLEAHWQALEKTYAESASEIAAKLATTSGSHLVPASD